MIRRPQNRGVALLMTMWILIVLGMIALQLSVDVRRNLKIARYQRDDLAARNLAKAGVGMAVTDLKNDLIADYDPDRVPYDAPTDIWNRDLSPQNPIEMGQGSFWYRVIDEDSRMNINRASDQLLFYALLYLNMNEFDAARIASAIVDWRDGNDTPHFMNEELKQLMMRNARDAIYTDRLYNNYDTNRRQGNQEDQIKEDMVYPYINRNENILVLEELLEVYGVTEELLYGRDPVRDPLPDYPFPFRMLPVDQMRSPDIFQLGLVHLFTAHPTEALNINTAPIDVLAIYLGSQMQGDFRQSFDLAKEVVEFRQGSRFRSVNEDHVFTQVPTDLGKVSNLLTVGTSAMSQHPLKAESNYFTIYAEGRKGVSRALLGVTVKRHMGQYEIVDPYEQQLRERSRRRGRARERNSRENAEQNIYQEPVVTCRLWLEW